MPHWKPFSPLLMIAVMAFVAVVGGCGVPAAASFDPTTPCIADGSAPGAYPDLEAMVPATYEAKGPETLDSGRKCTPDGLGSLAQAGFDEVRFAGGTWGFGAIRAAALVVFSAPGLTADDVAAFYTASARTANRTQITAQSTPMLAGRPGHRLDTMTSDRQQTVVVWPAAVPDVVNVVLTNDLPDPKIDAAVEAFGGR